MYLYSNFIQALCNHMARSGSLQIESRRAGAKGRGGGGEQRQFFVFCHLSKSMETESQLCNPYTITPKDERAALHMEWRGGKRAAGGSYVLARQLCTMPENVA